MQKSLFMFFALLAVVAAGQQADQVGASPGPGVKYATDAYPGFDADKDIITPERKEPRWFAFINGPKGRNAAEQMAWCQTLERDGDWSKAAKAYDALVREWPAAEEAPAAQLRLAEIRLEKEHDLDDALEEYRYLVDFYSSRCDYDAAMDRMYEIAGLMREEGKTIVFFHFRNTVEVRRAYEGCVLRAPGAKWAAVAMLTIGRLREDEGKLDEAVAVYENLRNLHYGTDEAKTGLLREAAVRMRILEERGYNRDRCRDTIGFLELAERTAEGADAETIGQMLAEVHAHVDEAAWQAAKFYDSRMRTKSSAINAYEQFLKDCPTSPHADEARARLEELKGTK